MMKQKKSLSRPREQEIFFDTLSLYHTKSKSFNVYFDLFMFCDAFIFYEYIFYKLSGSKSIFSWFCFLVEFMNESKSKIAFFAVTNICEKRKNKWQFDVNSSKIYMMLFV